ncbi:uncharacterized protein IL334_003599 [Kwoniella shivajii]|uniref:DUF4203 domain-containing protein n=1 Tax=Kwoniella shivajii TaxID=564305 RepID=A0ABZ1CY12_9TREE|nr:hypothetical protein IL334_003599 [Kwoniella shivajii]
MSSYNYGKDDRHHRRPLDMVIYFITFGLGVATVASTANALVRRNAEVGFATRAAATQGVKVIIATNALTQPGYALCSAASGVVVNSLTLLAFSFNIPRPFRKLVWLLPIAALFNFIFMLATCIAVFYNAKTGHITAYGTLNGIVLPQSVLQANAKALGLSYYFWGKGYVKFMAIISVPTTLFSLLTAILAFTFWRREKSSRSQIEANNISTRQNNASPTFMNGEEKGTTQHIDRV